MCLAPLHRFRAWRMVVARAEVARTEVSRQQSSGGSLPRSGEGGGVAELLIEMDFIKIRALMVGFGDALKVTV